MSSVGSITNSLSEDSLVNYKRGLLNCDNEPDPSLDQNPDVSARGEDDLNSKQKMVSPKRGKRKWLLFKK